MHRVEDTDRARSTKDSEDAVLEDLKWLGLEWDEGEATLLCPPPPADLWQSFSGR